MNRPLTLVPPRAITDATLIETDVPEDDYPQYSPAVTYAIGQRVILLADHSIYESVEAVNFGHPPTTSPEFWVRVGPTNRWRLFDGSNSSQTTKAGSFSYRLRPRAAVSCIAALNVTGALQMRVQMIDPTFGTVYDRTDDFSPVPTASDWYSWFFGERIGRASSVSVQMDLPNYPNADLLVEFTGGPMLAVGVLLIGQARQIGAGVKAGARVGIIDYSRKETNDFGDVVVVQRAFAKRAAFDLVLLRDEVDGTIDLLASLRTTPCLWVGNGFYASTVIYGYYKEFEVLIAYLSASDCTLQIEGLT